MGQKIMTCLVACDGHIILTRFAEVRKNDRHLHQCGGQGHGLQRTGLAIPKRTGIPKIYSLLNWGHIGNLTRRFRSTASQHDECGEN